MHTIFIRPFAALKLSTVAGLILLSGCYMPGPRGNGHITSESRNVPEFSAVKAGGAFDIQWVSGPTEVVVTTDKNLQPHITATVAQHTLRLDWDEQVRPTKGIKVKLSSGSLSAAELNGAVRFAATKLAGDSFALEGNGATRCVLDGSIARFTANLNGASRLDADQLQTRECEMSISGAGRADVNATEMLNVSISGAGKVTYGGNPAKVEKRVSGAGKISRRE